MIKSLHQRPVNEHDIMYKPRTNVELENATRHRAPICVYSAVCDMVKKHGVGRTLSIMFQRSPNWIILLQDPKDMDSGHWMSLSIHPAKKEIYFFSTYGGKPDFEKNQWLTEDDQIQSGQNTNALNDALKQMALRGWTIHYNNHKYQKEGDKTATCGIWVAAFLNSGMNPDQFYAFNKRYGLDAVDYYRMYFL